MKKQLILYILVGISNTLLTLGVMAVLARLGLHYVLYTTAGYGLGFLNSFWLNGRYTFAAKGLTRGLFSRFLVANVGLYLLVQAVQAFLIEMAHWPEIVAVPTGMVLYTGIGFLLNRRLFAKPDSRITKG